MKHLIVFYGPTGSGKTLISQYMRNQPNIIIYPEYSPKYHEKEILNTFCEKENITIIIETSFLYWTQLVDKIILKDVHIQICKIEKVRKNEYQ